MGWRKNEMYLKKIIIPVFLLVFSPLRAYADSAMQSDWSGGEGIPGPVLDWGIAFFQSSNIDWSGYPGIMQLSQGIQEHLVDGDFDFAYSVYSEDIDGDGDMDVLGAASSADDITWWENTDGSGTSWVEHTIDGAFDGASSVYSKDIDGDGDMDVLGAASFIDNITWWENTDGSGTSWIEHTVDGDFDYAYSVYSEDIDGDGDMDVLGAAWQADDITWWENTDGSGTSWVEHTIDGAFDGAGSVYSKDIDGDGDMDVLGAAASADDITWWENTDGSGTSWVEHTIDEAFNGAWSVYSEDIDGDGDMDVLGAAFDADNITWWENTDGSGTSWVEHTVSGVFDGAVSVYSEDFDGDGDMDILGAAWDANDITWWENTDGTGTSWAELTVDENFDGAVSVYSEDVDGDGDMDFLGASWGADDITWWDITGYSPSGLLESSILNTDTGPIWDYFEWSSNTPPGTSVSFQVRASTDYTNMGAWSDTMSSPCVLTGILNNGDSYVQYRALLNTTNLDITPILNDMMITWDPQGVEGDPDVTEYLLFGVNPNPSCGAVSIGFAVPEMSPVELSIYDLTGRLAVVHAEDEYVAGCHQVQLRELAPGIYFCRMISGEFMATQRFVVIE